LNPDFNTSDARRAIGEKLERLMESDLVRIIDATSMPSGTGNVAGFSTDTFGLIYIVSQGAFFTGSHNGKPLSKLDAWKGMKLGSIRESMIIHEFMHHMGIVGPDNEGQEYVLPNGQQVRGPTGISQAIRENCFK
jgi:hypothetical protein